LVACLVAYLVAMRLEQRCSIILVPEPAKGDVGGLIVASRESNGQDRGIGSGEAV
jgi:hypothetical protein